jgi:hypothetical protein
MAEFFSKYNGLITLLRYIILPVVMAALLFWLDGRYVQKNDWTEYKHVVQQASIEQRQIMAKLTDAIAALANEQRNVAELQRVNGAQISNFAAMQTEQWAKAERRIEKIEDIVTGLSITVTRHDAVLSSKK